MEGFLKTEEESDSSQITSYRIAQQQSMISFKFTSQAEKIVPLPDYEGLVIFENGTICKVNFLHERILNTGFIDKDIKKIVLYDKTTVAFISYSEKRVGFFDFVKFELTQPLIINLPTELGMPASERTESALEDLFRDGLDLIVLPESKFIVILEVKNTYQHSSENVITAFHESKPNQIFSQVKYSDPRQKMFLMEPINRIDTICIYSQIVDKDPIELLIWNISKKGEGLIPQFKLTDIIEGVVQTVFEFGENTAGVIINMSDSQKSFPILKVFNFTQGSPAKEITTVLDVAPQNGMNGANSNIEQLGAQTNDQRSFCLTDVFLKDVAAQKIIWMRLGQDGRYFDVYNPKSNKIVFEYFIGSNSNRDDEDNNELNLDSKLPSVDKKYILSYLSQLSDASDCNKQDITFMISSIVEVKSSIMYLLMQKDIPKIYGEEVCKNIIDMLTKSEAESG